MEVSSLWLDAYTLVFSIAMLASLMAAVSFVLCSGTSGDCSGLNEWGKAMVCLAGAFFLFFFRGHGPWVLTFLVANTLVLVAMPFGLLAYARLFEVAVSLRVIALVTVFGMSGVLAVYFFEISRGIAIFTLSLGAAPQLGLIATTILKNTQKNSTLSAWFSGVPMVLLAIAFASRALLALFGDASSVTPAANSLPQLVALFVGAVFIAVSSVGFIAMVNEKKQRETLDRLRRDGLTGLYTRSAFFEMSAEIEAIGATEGYAVVFIDIDHFKSLNDNFGHAGGDVTLAHAARLIASSIRISDIAVRYGGEEFCILLRGCAEPEAALLAESLVSKAALQTVRLQDGRSAKYTFSAGYACMQARKLGGPATETLEDVIERADQALYRAKGQGRNRALAAHPITLPSEILVT